MPQHVQIHNLIIVIELLIPVCNSLKSKRRVIKSLKDRVRVKFNVSIAEIDFLNEWQRSVIGVSMIGNDRMHINQSVKALERLILEIKDIELLRFDYEWS